MIEPSTLSEATNLLHEKGYTLDFNIEENVIHCKTEGLKLSPDEFEVVETFRFEGMSDPSDNSIVYAIESHHGKKGILVNAYGVYANTMTNELISKLEVRHDKHI